MLSSTLAREDVQLPPHVEAARSLFYLFSYVRHTCALLGHQHREHGGCVHAPSVQVNEKLLPQPVYHPVVVFGAHPLITCQLVVRRARQR